MDEEGKVALDSKETRAAIDYARAMQETMIPGTMSWNGTSNNQAFAAGNIGLTQNGVSIYYAAKNAKDPAQQAVAADIDHSEMPRGVAKSRTRAVPGVERHAVQAQPGSQTRPKTIFGS